MRENMKIASVVIGFSLALTANAQAKLSLGLSALTPNTSVGQGVVVRVTVTNSSDRAQTYHNTSRDCDYLFTVTDSSRTPVPETDQRKNSNCDSDGLKVIMTGRNITVTLKPGESDSEDIRLSDLFLITVPGTYTVQVSRKFPAIGTFQSNKITVTVSRAGGPS
jgi:hypothetical protein